MLEKKGILYNTKYLFSKCFSPAADDPIHREAEERMNLMKKTLILILIGLETFLKGVVFA